MFPWIPQFIVSLDFWTALELTLLVGAVANFIGFLVQGAGAVGWAFLGVLMGLDDLDRWWGRRTGRPPRRPWQTYDLPVLSPTQRAEYDAEVMKEPDYRVRATLMRLEDEREARARRP